MSAPSRDAQIAVARIRIAEELCPCHAPALLRLAISDGSTYDSISRTGANGTIRTPKALAYTGNEGLERVCQQLEALRGASCPGLTAADLLHLAGVVAAEYLGGPVIPFRPGRRDSKVGARRQRWAQVLGAGRCQQ